METFMVRVWSPGTGERPEGVRGTAVHLPSGQSVTFSDAATLISFLAREADGDADAADPDARIRGSASISHGQQ
jgi:hypothetical protein